jgi:protein-S-isoprenylcysteine O-methyltransferase Ste14
MANSSVVARAPGDVTAPPEALRISTFTVTAPPAEPVALRTWRDWLGFTFNLQLVILALAQVEGIGIAPLLPVLFEAVLAFTFLVRRRPRASLPGVTPKLVAYATTFLNPIFFVVCYRWAPAVISPATLKYARIGDAAWLAGSLLSLWPIWHLRRSFGLSPEARDLVRTGPYRLARHPIYAAYVVAHAGLFLQRPSVALALVLLCWLCFLRVRIGYEEQVLTAAFPEYAGYQKQVGALGPKRFSALWRRSDGAATS